MDEAVLHINVDKRCSLWSYRKVNHKLCLDQPIRSISNEFQRQSFKIDKVSKRMPAGCGLE